MPPKASFCRIECAAEYIIQIYETWIIVGPNPINL